MWITAREALVGEAGGPRSVVPPSLMSSRQRHVQAVLDELERSLDGASLLMTEQRRATTPTPRLVMASP